MTDIYDQHRAAFSNVAAYVVMRDDERVATIAFKFPKDGAGRLYAYVHFIRTEMVRGFAGGGGYDKKSAAIADAAKKISGGAYRYDIEWQADFVKAISIDGGSSWEYELRRAGFDVFQAV